VGGDGGQVTSMTAVTTELVDAAYLIRVDDGAVNALTKCMVEDLLAAVAAAPPDAALVIAGRPGCLTAGLDRSTMLSGDPSAVSRTLRQVTEFFEAIMAHPAPTVVACTGHALAAGALLLLVADHRVGARVPSKIGFNESRIGLPLGPLAVAAARLRLDSRALVRATVEGVVYDAEEALAVGYLDALTDADAVVDTALAAAQALAALRRKSYLRTRELVWSPVHEEVSRVLAQREARPAVGRPG
jgi:enoyl-CoA hydratase